MLLLLFVRNFPVSFAVKIWVASVLTFWLSLFFLLSFIVFCQVVHFTLKTQTYGGDSYVTYGGQRITSYGFVLVLCPCSPSCVCQFDSLFLVLLHSEVRTYTHEVPFGLPTIIPIPTRSDFTNGELRALVRDHISQYILPPKEGETDQEPPFKLVIKDEQGRNCGRCGVMSQCLGCYFGADNEPANLPAHYAIGVYWTKPERYDSERAKVRFCFLSYS